MKAHLAALLAAVLALFTWRPALAETDLRKMVVEHNLANGMKFLLVRRGTAPVFTAYVRVKAGGADEQRGKTGLAHLFEHLAFKGTSVVGSRDWPKEQALLLEIARAGDELAQPGLVEEKTRDLKARISDLSEKARALEHGNALTELLTRNGASNLNAETDKDLTSYYVSLPANRLELWALLEASRLAAPVPRDFYAERSVVMEERRERVENEPIGMLLEELSTVAFTTSPYRWPVVGYPEDLESLSMRDALEFHRAHYAPANAVGAIVGDIDLEATKALLDRTFGAVPARPPPPPLPASEAPRRSERRSTVYFDAASQLAVAFLKPTLPTRDDYIFDILQLLTTEGRTSRLYKALVTDQGLCSDVTAAMMPGARLPHLFVILVTPLADKPLDVVEKALFEELDKLREDLMTPAELARVHTKLDADFSRQLATNQGLAESLSFFEAVAGDWRYLADHRKTVASITAEDVRAAARKYLVPENRTVLRLTRPSLPAAEVAP
ncbi:MAG TPA: pitrilysin family protein [Myxococcales bacterium]